MLVMDEVARVIQKIIKSGWMCPYFDEDVQNHPYVAILANILKIWVKETPGLY